MDALSQRSLLVLAIIAAAAAEGRVTPRTEDIGAALRAADMPIYGRVLAGGFRNVVPVEVAILVKAGRLLVHGGKRHRVYEIVATGDRTRPRSLGMSSEKARAVASRVRQASAGWPRPTRDSIAAHDAAMRLGPPIRIQGPAAGAEIWTHLAVRSSAPAQSLTGCSAALAAEVA